MLPRPTYRPLTGMSTALGRTRGNGRPVALENMGHAGAFVVRRNGAAHNTPGGESAAMDGSAVKVHKGKDRLRAFSREAVSITFADARKKPPDPSQGRAAPMPEVIPTHTDATFRAACKDRYARPDAARREFDPPFGRRRQTTWTF